MDPTTGSGASQGSGGGRGTPAPQPARRPTEITALLGRGTHFEGKLHFDGRVRIDGSFKGDIRGDDVLIIGEGAMIEGTVEVGTCIVTAGEVRANIRARDAIELYPPARVVGALHAPAIFIDRGVQFEGSCTMAPLMSAESDVLEEERVALPGSLDEESDSEEDDETFAGDEGEPDEQPAEEAVEEPAELPRAVVAAPQLGASPRRARTLPEGVRPLPASRRGKPPEENDT